MIIRPFWGNEFHEISNGVRRQSFDPSEPETLVAEQLICGELEVNSAVEAAHGSLDSWQGLSGSQRADHLYAWAQRITERASELAEAIAKEVGKPIGEAQGEVGRCVAILRYFAGDCVRSHGSVIPALVSTSLQYSQRIPLGVVGLITPWNFPLAIPLWKAAPALACGNAVILKPSEKSPLCSQLLAETSRGLPNGVFNVLTGDGSTGEHLVQNPMVRAVSFTGSVGAGSKIQASCAMLNKKCQCEMGGKNAAAILSDANLKRAAELVAGGAMRFAGQKCTATSRVIIEESVWDSAIEELLNSIYGLKVGHAMNPDTAIGPVIDQASKDRLEKIIHESDLPVLFKGEIPDRGHFVPVTLFESASPDHRLCQEELFGPILIAQRSKSFDQSVEVVNNSPFGLSTAVFTQNISKGLEFAQRAEAGLVRINGDTTGVDPHAPFGGIKASSSGSREQGEVAKDFYSDWKTIQVNP